MILVAVAYECEVCGTPCKGTPELRLPERSDGVARYVCSNECEGAYSDRQRNFGRSFRSYRE